MSATLPGPFKVTHINGHPNFNANSTVDGRSWSVPANLPDDKAKKAIGGVQVSFTSAGGGKCQNSATEFVAK